MTLDIFLTKEYPIFCTFYFQAKKNVLSLKVSSFGVGLEDSSIIFKSYLWIEFDFLCLLTLYELELKI